MNPRRQGSMSLVWATIGLTILGISGPVRAATVINNLAVTGSTCASSSGPYVVQQGPAPAGFVAGATQFIDRTFAINGTVLSDINGQTFIQTCNSDKNLSPGVASLVTFSVGQDSRVYILHDANVTPKPTWLTGNFTDLGTQVTNNNSHIFEVFVSNTTYATGSTVRLGSNIQSGANTSYAMYSIVVVPARLTTICATAAVVGLQWPPVASAAGYSVTRNGTSLATGIPVTYYDDQAVAASTSYTYSVSALSSTGSVLSTETVSATTAAASTDGDAPYCKSSTITSMTVNWSSGINQQDGSDLWSQTQGTDANEYGFFGDGGGFGAADNNTNSNGKVSWGTGEITSSTPGSLSGAVNVYGGVNPQHPATISGKATSILAVGSNFYAIGGVTSTTVSTIGGGANDQEIVYSIGNAWSWTDNAPHWTFCTATSSSTGFCPGSFLQNGAGYSGNTDGYVYIYGGTQNDFFGNGTPGLARTYLWRVKSGSILDDTAYQSFSGLDAGGNPTWATGSFSTLSSAMKPIFTDRGSRPLGLGVVVYNVHLKRYIGSAESNVNQVAFYEAPSPWGPWSTIGYFNCNPADNSGGWGNLGSGITFVTNKHGDGLGINFLDKWTSSDGMTMWVVFSSDGAASSAAQLVPLRGLDMDSFSAVPITFTLSH